MRVDQWHRSCKFSRSLVLRVNFRKFCHNTLNITDRLTTLKCHPMSHLAHEGPLLWINPNKRTLKKYDRRRENSRHMTDVGYLALSSFTFNSTSMRGLVSQLSHM